MRLVRLIAPIGLVALMSVSPALASKGDDAWAQCLWLQAPRSASNWIAMSPSDGDALRSADAYSLLAIRLQGFCLEKLRYPGKKYGPDFKAKALRSALVASKPAVIGDDVGNSNAMRCEIFEDDVLLGVTIAFGDPSGIHPHPPATAIKCQRVNDDGSLTDA